MFGKDQCEYEFTNETPVDYSLTFKVKVQQSWILKKAAMHRGITGVDEKDLDKEVSQLNLIPVMRKYWNLFTVGIKPHYKVVERELRQADDIELQSNDICGVHYQRVDNIKWLLVIKTCGKYKDLQTKGETK